MRRPTISKRFTEGISIFTLLAMCTWIHPVARGESFMDAHCWQVQGDQREVNGCGVRIPPLAKIIEVNGIVLPINNIEQLQTSDFPYLLLPKGTHFIRFNPSEKVNVIEIKNHFRNFYDKLRSHYGLPKSVNEERLLEACGDALDAYRQPFLLNIHGAYYDTKKQREQAVRKWKRALSINPTFAPAHLNLAVAYFSNGEIDSARRELDLAEIFNIGDVYSIAEAIWNIRSMHKTPAQEKQSIELEMNAYLPETNLSNKDKRMVGMLKGLSKYASTAGDRAKILNNLAIYFGNSNKPEWACIFFRAALNQLKADIQDYPRLKVDIMRHMRDVCRESEMKREAKEYAKVVLLLKK